MLPRSGLAVPRVCRIDERFERAAVQRFRGVGLGAHPVPQHDVAAVLEQQDPGVEIGRVDRRHRGADRGQEPVDVEERELAGAAPGRCTSSSELSGSPVPARTITTSVGGAPPPATRRAEIAARREVAGDVRERA